MELKVVCGCGQKYKFDVEPVNGQMPFAVNCPVCGVDGTPVANQLLVEHFTDHPPPPAPPAPGRVRINLSGLAPAPLPLSSVSAPPPISAPKSIAPIKPAAGPGAAAKEFNLGMGILGAFLGSALGGALVYGFFMLVHFRFPWSGIGIGALSGCGARWLARGTDTTLGIIAAVLAGASIVETFYLMYGDFFLFGIISIVICIGVAYRLASE